MAAAPKTPSFLPELKAFAANLKDVPYDKLLETAAAAGWDYQLQQVDAIGLADASVLVTFQILVGKPAEGRYEPFDVVSARLPPAPGPVSLAARMQLMPTLVWMFFGRLPPPPAAAEQTIDMDRQPDGDVKLPGEEPLAPEPEQEYVPRREMKMPNLVDHVEPDGVPIYIDLDSVPEQFDSGTIIDALLEDMDRAAVRFDSKAQVLALYSKNADAVDFLKELGTEADKVRLKELLDRHVNRIEDNTETREVRIPANKSATTPRRRRAA